MITEAPWDDTLCFKISQKCYPGCQRFFFSVGATELRGEAARASRETARKNSTTRSDAPRRWRARRPLVSRVQKCLIKKSNRFSPVMEKCNPIKAEMPSPQIKF